MEQPKELHYLEKSDETFETSDRLEVEAMRDEWKRRYPDAEITLRTIDPDTAQELDK